jgi:hypothetical protein
VLLKDKEKWEDAYSQVILVAIIGFMIVAILIAVCIPVLSGVVQGSQSVGTTSTSAIGSTLLGTEANSTFASGGTPIANCSVPAGTTWLKYWIVAGGGGGGSGMNSTFTASYGGMNGTAGTQTSGAITYTAPCFYYVGRGGTGGNSTNGGNGESSWLVVGTSNYTTTNGTQGGAGMNQSAGLWGLGMAGVNGPISNFGTGNATAATNAADANLTAGLAGATPIYWGAGGAGGGSVNSSGLLKLQGGAAATDYWNGTGGAGSQGYMYIIYYSNQQMTTGVASGLGLLIVTLILAAVLVLIIVLGIMTKVFGGGGQGGRK